MKHLIAFIIVLVLIHKTLADGDKTNCTKVKFCSSLVCLTKTN